GRVGLRAVFVLTRLFSAAAAAAPGGQGKGKGHPQPPPPPPPPPPPTLTLTLNPQSPITAPDNLPKGTVLSVATAAWSNGQAFTGTITLTDDDGGTFALTGTGASRAIILSPLGPGFIGDAGTSQKATITASQN